MSSQASTMPSPLILDVAFGTGTIKSVFLVPRDGSSTPTRFACPSLISVLLTTIVALASLASRDMTSRKEHVFSLHSTTPSPLILDAVSGIGTTKSVCPAPRDGFSMPTRSVCPFLTTALLMTTVEPASPASKDTTSRTEPVSSLLQTTPSLLTLAVVFGTGTTKSAFPAPTDGSSTPTRSVCPFLTNALQATVLEPALLAMKVMTSRTELASSLPSTMPTQLTSVALLGTGNSKSALPAPRDGSSTPTRPACQSMTTATPTMKTVPALHATKATE